MTLREQLKHVFDLSNKIYAENNPTLKDLENLENNFHSLITHSVREVEGMLGCRNFAIDGKDADHFHMYLINNVHQWAGGQRPALWMEAVDSVRQHIELYLNKLLQNREYSLLADLCVRYAQIYPDSPSVQNAVDALVAAREKVI